MSISIKNHEDRIKALENAKSGGVTIKKYVDAKGEYYDFYNRLIINETDWDILLLRFYPHGTDPHGNAVYDYGLQTTVMIFKVLIDFNTYSYLYVGDHTLNSPKVLVSMKEFCNTYVLTNKIDDTTYEIYFNCNPSGSGLPSERVKLGEYALLKLYYNFSYNIKREFYKVKFYTKRFICLHLKNFVLNKGGVSRNVD